MKVKVIKINTPDGQYTLPLIKVAEHRADYYNDNDPARNEAIEFMMEDNYEGIDWIMNNTDWEDWKEEITKINSKVWVLPCDFWCNSDDFAIVEIDDVEKEVGNIQSFETDNWKIYIPENDPDVIIMEDSFGHKRTFDITDFNNLMNAINGVQDY